MAKLHRYTPAEEAFLRENITGRRVEDLTAMFNAHFGLDVPLNSIHSALANRGLTSGVDCRFAKGSIPYNKGRKGIHPSPATEFKKGNRPVNYRPVGSERVNVDGYIEIKVADPRTWQLKHWVVWEEAHGKRPKGHALIFRDGNRLNVSLDNLMLISRAQLGVLNKRRLLQKDAEINDTALLTADLILKVGAVKRKHNRKERSNP